MKPSVLRRQAANAVTLLRLLLVPPFLLSVAGAGGTPAWLAAPLFLFIAASDVVDGCVARRLGTTSSRGRAFDHAADICFVLAALSGYALLGSISWAAPIAVAVAFAVYVADSRSEGRRRASVPAIANRLGHFGGVCNYAVIGVLVGNETLGLYLLPSGLVRLIAASVVIYSSAAILLRYAPALRAALRTGTARRAAGRPRPAALE
jgi:phosphatidylglycerophosphate synthase